MSQNNWFSSLSAVNPYIFRISTPSGTGTGFQIFTNSKGLCGVATAYHVISHAYEWEEPIKITHQVSQQSRMLKVGGSERVVFVYPDKDLAIIVFPKADLPIETEHPQIVDPGTYLKPGNEIGWLGFPSLAPGQELCFFAGHISAYLETEQAYLVDGVAINGVSGGPAFFLNVENQKIQICGVISAYMPNRIYGEALPGLSIIRSVESYQITLQQLKTIDEAEEKKVEEEKDKDGLLEESEKNPE